MDIKLNNNSTGAWFPYFASRQDEDGAITYLPPDPASKDRVFINPPLTVEQLEAIYARTRTRKSEFVINPKTRQMERVTYFDQSPEQMRQEFEEIFCVIIGEYELTDADGAKIPVTRESKIQLMRHPEFARYVNRCLQMLEMSEAERKEQLEKN